MQTQQRDPAVLGAAGSRELELYWPLSGPKQSSCRLHVLHACRPQQRDLLPPVPASWSCTGRSHTLSKQSSCHLHVWHPCRPQWRDYLPEAPGPAAPELVVRSLYTHTLQASITYLEPAFPQLLRCICGCSLTDAPTKHTSSAFCMQADLCGMITYLELLVS